VVQHGRLADAQLGPVEGAAGSVSASMTGEVISMPPGADSDAVTTPTTETVVSSGSASSCVRTAGSVTTIWVSPAASRRMRKATDFSSRRR
jgi:hypothetical protein